MPSVELESAYPYALGETLFSGQAFRWQRKGRSFEGVIGREPVRLRNLKGRIDLEYRGGSDIENAVAWYLRMDDPLDAIYRAIGKDDPMRRAVARWKGLHLLAQDPWETTVSFIASSASNVPKISRSIEKMCRALGEETALRGGVLHTFPPPERLARASLAELGKCEFGYRAAYIRSAARAVAEGEVDLKAVAKLPTDDAQARLVAGLDGIGPKVAACIVLFSMGKDDAFPVDRHVQRAVSQLYFGGRRISERECAVWGRQYFGRWAGYAQQYLFHERRSRARTPRGAPSH